MCLLHGPCAFPTAVVAAWLFCFCFRMCITFCKTYGSRGLPSRSCLIQTLDAIMNALFRQRVSPLRVTSLAILASAERSYRDCNAVYEEAINFEMRALEEARNAVVACEELQQRQKDCHTTSCQAKDLGRNTEIWPIHYCGHSCSCPHKWLGALLCANMSSTTEGFLAYRCECFSMKERHAEGSKETHRQNRFWEASQNGADGGLGSHVACLP